MKAEKRKPIELEIKKKLMEGFLPIVGMEFKTASVANVYYGEMPTIAVKMKFVSREIVSSDNEEQTIVLFLDPIVCRSLYEEAMAKERVP